MYTVRIASSDEFRGMRADWNRLASAMRMATPFSSWEWANCWWTQFGAGRTPVVLLILEGNALRGILPLATMAASSIPFAARGALEFMGVHMVGADHTDLIADAEHVGACTEAAIAYLRSSGLSWHTLKLPLLAEDSELMRSLSGHDGALTSNTRQASVAPYLPIAGSFENYLASLSSNERYKLRSRSKKLFAKPGLRYHRFAFAERGQALDALFDLHERRAQEKQIASSFAHGPVKAFHAALLDQLPWEHVVLRGLMSGDDVIAMFYGFLFGRRMFYFQLGYDPAWSAASPGLVLLTRTINEAFDEGCVEYNFLQGDEPFKQTWTRQARRLFDCRVFNRTVRGNVSHELFRLRETIRRTVRRSSSRAAPHSAAMPDNEWHEESRGSQNG